MKRNLRFILTLMKLKMSRMMVFRFSFFGGFFADAMLFAVQLLTFAVVYSQVDSIGGWNRGQMIIFVGTFSLLNGLSTATCFFGLVNLPDKIKNGGLDQYLTKPVSPLLRIFFEDINPGSLLLVVFSALVIVYGVHVAGISVSAPMFIAYVALVLLMEILYCDMELILRTVPFLVVSADGIMMLEDELLNLNFKTPGVLFHGGFKVLFYFALPYGVMATVPTQLLSGAFTAVGLAWGVAIAVAFTAFALWFWRFGLRHYKSASS